MEEANLVSRPGLLPRSLAFIAGRFDLHMEAHHIKGADNSLADALSRNNVLLFHSLFPEADEEATAIPQPLLDIPKSLLDILIVSKPDWTSRKGTSLWSSVTIIIVPSTQKSYNSAKKQYVLFCSSKGLVPLPASEHQLCQFASFLATRDLCHNSIKSYLAAIRHLHIAEGIGGPHISRMAKLEQALSLFSAKNPSRKLRLPILPHHLAKMRRVWMKDSFHGTMLWAAASLCFFGFFCSGEITIPSDLAFDVGAHLCFSDVSVNNMHYPQIIKVHLSL